MTRRLNRNWASEVKFSNDLGHRKYKFLVSGREGSGKTQFAGTWPSPFVIATEEGTLTLADKAIPFIFISNDMPVYETVLMILLEAKTKTGAFAPDGPYGSVETIVIDGFTALNNKLMAEILEGAQRVQAQLTDWLELKYKMSKICALIPELPYHVIGTVGIAAKDDQITKMQTPSIDIDGGYRDRLPHDFDFSLWLTCQTKGGDVKYIAYTKEHRQKYSKARAPKAWPKLPKEIENIDFQYVKNYFEENLHNEC